MSQETKINVAKALTVQLHVTEEAIDTALSEAAHLIETYISSRRAVRMSAMISGDVHESTLKAMMALNTAQQHMADAHRGLSLVQQQVGIRAGVIIPPFDKPDPDDPGNGGITSDPPLKRRQVAF